jgi:hypothetical protein
LVVAARDSVSRRLLLGRSAAAGGALLLAGCGHSASRLARLPPAVRGADVELLNQLLDVEHLVATAYIAAIPLLTGHPQRAAKHFLDHETQHIQELEKLVRKAGGQPPSAKPSYDLGHPSSATELLELLRRVEDRAIGAYLAAIPKLSLGEARQSATSILAVEAQHTSIIRRDLGLRPVPGPLVAGPE